MPDDLLQELTSLQNQLRRIPLRNNPNSKSYQQISTLKQLHKDPNIIIKPADKGSSLVIMDTQDYIFEANRQLNNPLHYAKIDTLVSPDIRDRYLAILNDLKHKKFLTKKQVKYLSPPINPRIRKFYLLPKIHKNRSTWTLPNMPPGRPIVSDCSSDSYRISEYIDHFIRPIATKHPSYIKDTPHFIQKIKNITIPPNALLITLDVESLYTNIDNRAGIAAIRTLFDKYPNPKRPDQQILELLDLSLSNNDFQFLDSLYLQIWGTAMGKRYAPGYADAFLAVWDSEILQICPLKPLVYLRYLDDIFIIWTHSIEEFHQFIDILNSHRPTIKLKPTISNSSIDFLDVTIYKGPSFPQIGILDTKVYFKPTDTHELLHKLSFHPKHTFPGILKSQFLRFHRICSNHSDFLSASKTLIQVLRTRGYSKSLLRKVFRDTTSSLKTPLTTSKPCPNPNCLLCPTFLNITNSILDHNQVPHNFDHTLTCSSSNIIYAITCTYCNSHYIGQTSLTLKERFNAQKSILKHSKPSTLTSHFLNNFHPHNDFVSLIKILPLEKVPPVADRNLNLVNLLSRETHWMSLMQTHKHGINHIKDCLGPMPFILTFHDNSHHIVNQVRKSYQNIQQLYPKIFKSPLIIAYKRNKNILEYVSSASAPKNTTPKNHITP